MSNPSSVATAPRTPVGDLAFAEAAAVVELGRGRRGHRGSHLVEPDLLAVADGDHTHPAGALAAALAVAVVAEWRLAGGASEPTDVEAAFRGANHEVIALAREQRGRIGTRTGLTLALVADRRLLVGHVGAARAYLIRDRRPPLLLTRDHTALAALRERGIEVGTDGRAGQLGRLPTQWIGSRVLEPHLAAGEVAPGDLVLICAGGVLDLHAAQTLGRAGPGALRVALERLAEHGVTVQDRECLMVVAGRVGEAESDKCRRRQDQRA